MYSKNHTVNVWVKVITKKFNDIPFMDRSKDIGTILGITSKSELKKIDEASFIAFGNSLGISTFEDACKKLGISTRLPNLIDLGEELSKKYLAEYKLNIIIKALNEGWYPNWNNTDEYKYFPYFNMTSEGFSYWSAHYYFATSTDVPSALVLKTKELAIYCGSRFTNLYEEYYK